MSSALSSAGPAATGNFPSFDEVYRRLIADELLTNFIAKTQTARQAGQMPPVSSVADVLGEQRVWALAVLVDGLDPSSPGAPTDGLERTGRAMAILASSPYLWPNEMFDTARECRVPPHVIGKDLLPTPMMWWTLSRSVPLSEGGDLEAFQIISASDEFSVIQWCAEDGKAKGRGITIPFGARFPNDIPEQNRTGVEDILGLLSFLSSRYVSTEEHHLPRAFRRRRSVSDIASVHFVDLRRAEKAAGDQGKGIASPIDWACRWLVRGHHRAQWYPASKSHRVIWVPPYVKGPADKPFAMSVARIAR